MMYTCYIWENDNIRLFLPLNRWKLIRIEAGWLSPLVNWKSDRRVKRTPCSGAIWGTCQEWEKQIIKMNKWNTDVSCTVLPLIYKSTQTQHHECGSTDPPHPPMSYAHRGLCAQLGLQSTNPLWFCAGWMQCCGGALLCSAPTLPIPLHLRLAYISFPHQRIPKHFFRCLLWRQYLLWYWFEFIPFRVDLGTFIFFPHKTTGRFGHSSCLLFVAFKYLLSKMFAFLVIYCKVYIVNCLFPKSKELTDGWQSCSWMPLPPLAKLRHLVNSLLTFRIFQASIEELEPCTTVCLYAGLFTSINPFKSVIFLVGNVLLKTKVKVRSKPEATGQDNIFYITYVKTITPFTQQLH